MITKFKIVPQLRSFVVIGVPFLNCYTVGLRGITECYSDFSLRPCAFAREHFF
jgi:hypothetical protein